MIEELRVHRRFLSPEPLTVAQRYQSDQEDVEQRVAEHKERRRAVAEVEAMVRGEVE